MSFTTYHSRREQQYGGGNPKGERVASFQSDVNSSTSPPKITTERWGKMGKQFKQNNRHHNYFRTATNERNESNSSKGKSR